MADPERLFRSLGPADALERAVLRSLREVTIPSGARGLVWSAVSAQGLQAASFAGGSGATSSLLRAVFKAAVSSKALLLAPVVVAALTVATLGRQAVPAPATPPAPPMASAAVRAASPALDSNGLAQTLPEPAAPVAHDRPPASPIVDGLAKESALLTRARAQLRAGKTSAAQATLARIAGEFSSGALRQERDVLAIEALAAQGNVTAAERLARAFIAAHPESPHADQLRRFLMAP